ncbi:MAG TPA: response regulator [Bryobacteraceae bacterium]|nr:response regulator [Bryobacteraceae bacterium]
MAAIVAWDIHQSTFTPAKGVLLFCVVAVVAAGISRFTIVILARPLAMLQQGITQVRNGRLEPIQVSSTGDEIEYLGESFNSMIEALVASRKEIRQHQDLLEERIRQRTEELEEAMLRSEAASQAKSEFLANMSHELRTPMAGILGMIDVTLESELNSEQREQLETAQRCAWSLLALLNDILDLSKIESGRMGLEQIPFNIKAVLHDCVKSLQPRAGRSEVELSCEIAADVPDEVFGDPLRVRQIFANLLSNAVKFTERGYIRARLFAPVQNDLEVTLRFEVEDTGIGIPKDKLPLIFDKFTQADGSVSRRYGGTGLGLAITQRLVDLHRGQIRVQSEVGKGSIFSADLTCLLVSPGQQTTAAEEEHQQAVADQRSAANRILVVEDNQVNQKVVTAVLKKRGFEIELANNGEQALTKLENSTAFDLILMDVQMPVLDGLEATRRIRQNPRWRELPILAMTAHAMNGDRERCIDAGMNGYISKPVHPSHLLRVLSEYLPAPATT